jgi:hypothetical protein
MELTREEVSAKRAYSLLKKYLDGEQLCQLFAADHPKRTFIRSRFWIGVGGGQI